MKDSKLKSFLITLLLCVVIYFVYTTARDIWIIKENENYEIKEYVIDENFKEIK